MPKLDQYLSVAPGVRKALDAGRPVVALESTDITHGLPWPQNVETALRAADIVREGGAEPAIVAVLNGRLRVGLTSDEVERLGKMGPAVHRASRRDIPLLLARGEDGAATAAAAMFTAALVGARVFATGGIGGVQRGGERTLDVSADLEELAQTPVVAVCSGVKSAVSINKTMEYLETHSVPVVGFGTDEVPAFYTCESGRRVDYRVDTPVEVAKFIDVQRAFGIRSGLLVAVPVPEPYAIDRAVIDHAVHAVAEEAEQSGITGAQLTAFMLQRINEMTGGKSQQANIQLICNNARVAADIAREFRGL